MIFTFISTSDSSCCMHFVQGLTFDATEVEDTAGVIGTWSESPKEDADGATGTALPLNNKHKRFIVSLQQIIFKIVFWQFSFYFY